MEGESMSLQRYWSQKITPELRESGPGLPERSYRVILELAGKETREIQAIVQANQGKLYQKNSIVSSLVAEVPSAAIEALAKSKEVKRIWRDKEIRICKEESFTKEEI